MGPQASSSPGSAALDKLYGLVAVQQGFAHPQQVVTATLRQRVSGKSLADELVAAKVVSPEQLERLAGRVSLALEKNGGDPKRTFDSLGGDEEIRRSLGEDAYASFGGGSGSDSEVAATRPPPAGLFESFGGGTPAPAPVAARPASRVTPSLPGLEPSEGASTSGADPGQRDALATAAALRTREAKGKYTTVRELGRGGQSLVHVVMDHDLGREIAVKELLPNRKSTRSGVARFIREARIAGQLEHPNIVPVYELGLRENGGYYAALRLVRGDTFARALEGRKTLSERLELLDHYEGLCNAIAYAHSQGVIHRDVKPENVMVGGFGETVVLDWGLAKVHGQSDLRADELEQELKVLREKPSPGMTMVGTAIGTPTYMPPEQALGELDEIDERSDVWSLGAVLFELLTGRTPFTGDSAFDVMAKVIAEPAPRVRSLAPDAPPDLAAIADKALAKDRQDRYPSAKELAAEISAWRSGLRVASYDYSSFELLKRFVGKNKVLSAVVLGAVLFISAAAGVTYLRDRDSRRNLARAFVEKARVAERDLRWPDAAIFRAAARTYDDGDGLRHGVVYEGAYLARPVATLGGHTAPIDLMAVSPLKNLLVTGSRDHTIGFWDIDQQKLIERVSAHPRSSRIVVAFAPSGRWLVSSGEDAITVWNPETRKPAADFDAPNRAYGLAVSPDDDTVATGTDDTIELWSIQTRQVVRRWKTPQAPNILAFSADGKELVSGHGTGLIQVWDAQSGRPLRRLEGHTQWITFFRLSRDGAWVTSTSNDRKVAVFKLATGERTALLEGHESDSVESAFSPDARLLASVGLEGSLRVWNVAARAAVARIGVPGVSLLTVSFTPDGQYLLAAGSDHSVRVWRTPDHFPVDALDPSARDLTPSPDGQLLAFSAPDKSIGSWNLGSAAPSVRLAGHPLRSNLMAFSADSKRLASLAPSDVRVWDTRTGAQLASIDRYPDRMQSLALSPDGSRVAIGLYTGDVAVWDVGRGTQLAQLPPRGGTPAAVSFSQDGSRLGVRYTDGAVLQFETAGWTPAAGGAPVQSAQFFTFAADGSALWQTADGVLHRWEPASGTTVSFPGHARPLLSAAVSADGRTLISAGEDAAVRISEARTGSLIAAVDHHWAGINAVAMGPGEGEFTVSGTDGQLRRFRLRELLSPREDLDTLLQAFRVRLEGIDLTPATAP